MAHAVTINKLTDDLVRSIVTSKKDNLPFDSLRESAVKTLRTSSQTRTNQFDVRSKLNGLVEKFAVLNRDDLSEALQSSLNALPTELGWLPEILSLLLQISDRPLERTKSEDVRGFASSQDAVEPSLTWEAIIAEEPLEDDDGLWDVIDRGYHSSGDDATVDGELDSDLTTSTNATSAAEEDLVATARSYVIPIEENRLEDINSLQKHVSRGLDGTDGISELFLIRETIMMLHGLPTSLYAMDKRDGNVTPNHDLRLQTAARWTMLHVMNGFADLASSINVLRHWATSEQQIPYLQSCQASIQQMLSRFGQDLAAMEQTYLQVADDVVVSVLQVRSAVERFTKPLVSLAKILKYAGGHIKASPFALLDALYDGACTSQLSGDIDTFAAILSVLLSGLRTYLKSVARWIAYGLCDADDPTYLIEDRDWDCDMGTFWQERYAMKTSANGQPYAPIFMQSRASRIFALGKSQAFLRALKTKHASNEKDLNTVHPDFSDLDNVARKNNLSSLPELLEEALDSWLMTTAKDSTPSLRCALLEDHGLLRTYASLTDIFCSADGRAFQDFAEALFRSIDNRPNRWRNNFLLTELANNTIAGSNIADETSLTIRMAETSGTNNLALSSIRQIQSLALETAFSWPVQNITRTPSPRIHSQIFILLLQTYRAKSLLRNQFLALRRTDLLQGSLTGIYAHTLRLRQRLATTVEALYSHFTSAAAISNNSLLADTQKAEDVDAMAAVWGRHDKQLETSLLLGERLRPLHNAVVSHFEICEQFADIWKRLLTPAFSTTDGGEEPEADRNTDIPVFESLAALQDEANRLLSFIVAGLRGIGRAGGNTALETLADRLELTKH